MNGAMMDVSPGYHGNIQEWCLTGGGWKEKSKHNEAIRKRTGVQRLKGEEATVSATKWLKEEQRREDLKINLKFLA